MSVQAAVDAFAEVRDASTTVTPKDAFAFIDNYKQATGHRPSLSAVTLLYLRAQAKIDAAERAGGPL